MKKISCASCGKRYDCDADGFCPRCGAFNQQREKPAARGRKRAHSAAKEGGVLLGLEVVSDLAVDLVGDAISDLFS